MKIEEIKLNISEIEIDIDGEKVKVKQYLSTPRKIALIEAIQMEVFNTTLIDHVKLDALFNAFIILNYTDIKIGFEKTIDNLFNLYDYFESSGYMSLIIRAIPKVEYDALVGYLEETTNDFNRVKISNYSVVESLVKVLPTLMEEIKGIIDEIDIDSLTTLKDIYSRFEN